MIAVYAMGGGLGHLRRAQAVLAALASSEPAVLLSASPHARGGNVVRVPRRLAASPAGFAAWLRGALRSLRPCAVVVDAFPLGIAGELADPSVLPDVPLYHVARLLRWDAYAALFTGASPRYSATYAVEPLTPRHEAFLRRCSGVFHHLDLPEKNFPLPSDPFASLRTHGRQLWLVVHSGPVAEVVKLLGYARARARAEGAAATLVVVSPRRSLAPPEDVARFDSLDAAGLFPFADRVVTACGFNSMREGAAFPGKHLFLPFARRFDDQPLRALRRLRAMRP